MKYIYDNISTTGNSILVSIPQFLKRTEAVKEDFWCQYDADITGVPEHIASIPYILNIAPVIWALNLQARVRVVDHDLFTALPILRDALRTMYPALPWEGEILADDTKPTVLEGRGRGIFFSGGLDSVFSTLHHLGEKPALFTIRGSDISLKDDHGWNLVKVQANNFAQRYGLTNRTITSNFMTFLNQSMLADLSETFPGWWGGVQHGMGFAGLVAPMAQHLEISKFYLASSHSVDFTTPWGSDPRIDNHIRYAGVSFLHDGYEYTRHAKLAALINEIRTKGLKRPTLRVCYVNASNAGANCCVCEKCSRTITSLLIEGENPNEYGFSVPFIRFIRTVKASFAKTQFIFASNTLFHWCDIQRAIKTASHVDPAVQSYIEWVRDFDFLSYKVASQLRRKRLDPLVRLLSRTPLYSLAKRVYRLIA